MSTVPGFTVKINKNEFMFCFLNLRKGLRISEISPFSLLFPGLSSELKWQTEAGQQSFDEIYINF